MYGCLERHRWAVYISVWCGCLKTLLANRWALLNKYPLAQSLLIGKKQVLPPLCLNHPHVWTHPLKSAGAMTSLKLYICMDVYCTGANQNLMNKMSEMTGAWKTWSKITQCVCQLRQAHHQQQHRVNHPDDNTETAVGTWEHCSLVLYAYNKGDNIFLFVGDFHLFPCCQRASGDCLNLGDAGIVIQKSVRGLSKATALLKKREDTLDHISSEGEERQPKVMG